MKACSAPGRGDVSQATKIQVIMRRKNISQTEIARRHGIARPSVTNVIWGVKKTEWVRQAIAKDLGFSDWDEMMTHREVV